MKATAEEMRAVIADCGITQAMAAEALKVGARTVRDWVDPQKNGAPWMACELLKRMKKDGDFA